MTPEYACTVDQSVVNRYGVYTWIVSIGTDETHHIETGVLVGSQWVLTNAVSPDIPTASIRVRIVGEGLEYSSAAVHGISRILQHPVRTNIWLIRLDVPSDHAPVKIIATPTSSPLFTPVAVCVGWNRFGGGDSDEDMVLNELDVPLMSSPPSSTLDDIYGGYPGCDTGAVRCNVDTGAPLLVWLGDEMVLYGIADPAASSTAGLVYGNMGKWVSARSLLPWISMFVTDLQVVSTGGNGSPSSPPVVATPAATSASTPPSAAPALARTPCKNRGRRWTGASTFGTIFVIVVIIIAIAAIARSIAMD